jgi:hypothetical protein
MDQEGENADDAGQEGVEGEARCILRRCEIEIGSNLTSTHSLVHFTSRQLDF